MPAPPGSTGASSVSACRFGSDSECSSMYAEDSDVIEEAGAASTRGHAPNLPQ